MEFDREYLLPLKENEHGWNKLSIELKYNIGGNNGYRDEERGYYLHVQPFKIAGGVRTMGAYTGSKMLVHKVARKSKSAQETARKKADENLGRLANYVLRNNRIELDDGTSLELE